MCVLAGSGLEDDLPQFPPVRGESLFILAIWPHFSSVLQHPDLCGTAVRTCCSLCWGLRGSFYTSNTISPLSAISWRGKKKIKLKMQRVNQIETLPFWFSAKAAQRWIFTLPSARFGHVMDGWSPWHLPIDQGKQKNKNFLPRPAKGLLGEEASEGHWKPLGPTPWGVGGSPNLSQRTDKRYQG